jgi:fluoroquinolone transport system ATP-binding protein
MSVADELCDSVAFLVDGKISAMDTPYNLKLAKSDKKVCVEYVEYTEINTLKKSTFSLKGIGYNEVFLQLLRTHQIQTMHSQESTLEDVFIEKTGRNLQ